MNQEARIYTRKWPIKLAKFTCVERNKKNMLNCVSKGLVERMGKICKAGQGSSSIE